MKIDAHHHFWNYSKAEYDWIDDAMAVIRRDFLPADLEREIRAVGVDGVISVQARQTLEETRWLLSLAAENDFIKGVVGWVPLIAPDVRAHLAEFSKHPKLRGIRHVLQGDPDDRYMLREDFNRGIAALAEFGLVYDILILEKHLPYTPEFVDRHPQQTFVLDHIAKPRIRDNMMEPWAANIRELARRPNVFCKLSGMVTEADYTAWSEAQMLPYLDTVLEAFGPSRLIFATDWPVCLVACEYRRWHDLIARWASQLSADEQRGIFGETAAAVYRL